MQVFNLGMLVRRPGDEEIFCYLERGVGTVMPSPLGCAIVEDVLSFGAHRRLMSNQQFVLRLRAVSGINFPLPQPPEEVSAEKWDRLCDGSREFAVALDVGLAW